MNKKENNNGKTTKMSKKKSQWRTIRFYRRTLFECL